MNWTAEFWLFDRLKLQGVDVYVDGNFESLRDRLAFVISANGVADEIAGGRRAKRPETYAAVFTRIYGVPFPAVAPKRPKQRRTA